LVTSAIAHVTVSGTAPATLNLSSNLVLHLKFNGDALDYSGHGNDGSLVGGPTFVTDGPLGGRALHYSTDTASSDFRYVTLGLRPDLQLSSNVNFTVAYWIRYPSTVTQGGDLPVICNAVNSSYNAGYVFFQDQSNWGWTLHGSDPNQINIDDIGTGSPYADGNWHHFALTCDRAGLARTYVDGSEVSEKPIGELPSLDTGNPTIIGQDPSGTYGTDGAADIADVGVWRGVLNQGEVASIYVAGSSNHVSFVSTPLPLTISRAGNQVQLSWPAGILQSAPSVTGPYVDVSGAKSPYTTAASASRVFYRLRQ